MDIKSYLQQHARKLDLYLHEHLFGGVSPPPVLSELATYRIARKAAGPLGHTDEKAIRMKGLA